MPGIRYTLKEWPFTPMHAFAVGMCHAEGSDIIRDMDHPEEYESGETVYCETCDRLWLRTICGGCGALKTRRTLFTGYYWCCRDCGE